MEGNICKICGNNTDNEIYIVQERMINRGDSFHYLYCAKCKTLQLNDKVRNMALFYPTNYEPFQKKIKSNHMPLWMKGIYVYIMSRISLPELIKLFYRRFGTSGVAELYKTAVDRKYKVLDVGAGNGTFGKQLKELGFNYVKCVDLYCSKPLYDDIDFLNGDIFDVDGKFDFITLHHSFEHMDEPCKILAKVHDLLSDDGLCLIRIPVSNSTAWEEFHENWYQIDAPRHLYLYSTEAMNLLCDRAGLIIERVIFDSNPDQFYISRAYRDTNNSLSEIKNKSGIALSVKYLHKAFHANRTDKGDQACFYIRKK